MSDYGKKRASQVLKKEFQRLELRYLEAKKKVEDHLSCGENLVSMMDEIKKIKNVDEKIKQLEIYAKKYRDYANTNLKNLMNSEDKAQSEFMSYCYYLDRYHMKEFLWVDSAIRNRGLI